MTHSSSFIFLAHNFYSYASAKIGTSFMQTYRKCYTKKQLRLLYDFAKLNWYKISAIRKSGKNPDFLNLRAISQLPEHCIKHCHNQEDCKSTNIKYWSCFKQFTTQFYTFFVISSFIFS